MTANKLINIKNKYLTIYILGIPNHKRSLGTKQIVWFSFRNWWPTFNFFFLGSEWWGLFSSNIFFAKYILLTTIYTDSLNIYNSCFHYIFVYIPELYFSWSENGWDTEPNFCNGCQRSRHFHISENYWFVENRFGLNVEYYGLGTVCVCNKWILYG